MPYAESSALPFERASKLGHVSVVNDPLVQELLADFERTGGSEAVRPLDGDVASIAAGDPLSFVIAIDGSVSDVPNTLARHKTLSYVKVAALGLSLPQLERVQGPIVDPDLVTSLLSEGADTFSTVLPLSNVSIGGMTLYESIRNVLQTTFEAFFGGGVYDTLRYLVSREWLSQYTMTAHFSCPICEADVLLPRHQSSFSCPGCSADLTLVDYLALTNGLSEEGNDGRVATDLMTILENLLLIHYLKLTVEKGFSDRTLLLKDGPLMLAHQYSRLVDPIREYLAHLNTEQTPFYLAGVEKTGAFADHCAEINDQVSTGDVFIPSNTYILTYIKSGGSTQTRYGEKVLYAAKAFYRADSRNMLVLNVPYGLYATDVKARDLYGLSGILATLDRLGSRQFQNALLPIVAANRIASLSVYPSNKILERFAEAQIA
jgi:hypothetical protein